MTGGWGASERGVICPSELGSCLTCDYGNAVPTIMGIYVLLLLLFLSLSLRSDLSECLCYQPRHG